MRAMMPLAAIAMVVQSPAAGSTPRERTLFACTTGRKIVRITAMGDRLTYRFGSIRTADFLITDTARSGNILWMRQTYANTEYQMRFVKGAYSYIVYSMAGNAVKGTYPVSGVVVQRNGLAVSRRSCTRHAAFAGGYDYNALPQDSEAFTAM